MEKVVFLYPSAYRTIFITVPHKPQERFWMTSLILNTDMSKLMQAG
jgi:hypothetical protein